MIEKPLEELACFTRHGRKGAFLAGELTNFNRSLALFLAIAFGTSGVVGLSIHLSGGLNAPLTFPALILMMFSPALGAVAVTKLVTHQSLKDHGLNKRKPLFYILGWAYPLLFVTLGLVFVFLLRTTTVDLGNLQSRVIESPQLSNPALVLVLLLTGPFINFIPALGEEYGWRGFLQPLLVRRYGLAVGLTMTGAIWGLWHAPIVLQGYDYASYPNLVGVGLFSLWTVLVGFFFGWLRIKSSSCLPVALAHGAINAYAGLGLIIAPVKNELLGVPFGMPGFLALGIIAVIVLADLR
jgi:membrane protease YdiL (CAAX protease family)